MDIIHISEQELIKGCASNDRKSQEILYKKYFKKMFVMCYRYTSNEGIICEIINDAFLNVFKNISKFENRGSLEGWIRKITFNSLADYFRKEKKDIRFIFVDDDGIQRIADTKETSETYDYDDLISKIDTLQGSFKAVFIKYAIEGYSHREIGEDLKISEGTSKWYLSEARKKLQHLFNKSHHEIRYGR